MGARVDAAVEVGDVTLRHPVMTASGTAGYGAELDPYSPLSEIGAVVTKSLCAEAWPGNPAPRLTESPAGMLNAVGLQGPGVDAWIGNDLPRLLAIGARVVASIWGRSIDEYARAASMLADLPAEVVAVEVNLSCPNVEARGDVFAHSVELTRDVVAATEVCGRPRWAKLSPNVTDLVAIAASAAEAGADAVTLVNTVMGMSIDPDTRRPRLANGGGGLSGPAIRPVAVRAIHDVHRALPDLAIVGVGGVSTGSNAAELLLAGASAVQVGTASFAEPGAVARVQRELLEWCDRSGVEHVAELTGGAHESDG